MSRSARLRSAGCTLLAILSLVGCGSGDDAKSGAADSTAARTSTTAAQQGATPVATPVTTPVATPDTADDKRIASEATLKLDDFPSEWTEADDDRPSTDAKCESINEAKKATTARANSPSFEKDTATEVENSIYLYASEPAAQQAFDPLASKDTRLCLAKTVSDQLGDQEGVEVGDTKSARLSIEPLGDQREAARITFPLTSDGIDVDLVLDVVFVRVGRGISLSLYGDTFSAFDEELRARLTSTSVRRLSAGVS